MSKTGEFLFSWYGVGLGAYLAFTWLAWFGPEIPGTERGPDDPLEYWERRHNEPCCSVCILPINIACISSPLSRECFCDLCKGPFDTPIGLCNM